MEWRMTLRGWLVWFRKEVGKTEPREWFLATIGGAILLIIGFAMLVLAGYELTANYHNLPPLPDRLYRIIPQIKSFEFLNNVGLLTTLLVLFPILISRVPHRIPVIFSIGFFWFITRVTFMFVTPLGAPDSGPRVTPDINVGGIWDLIRIGLSSDQALLFSGHTGLPFLGFLFALRERSGHYAERMLIRVKTLLLPFGFIVLYYLLLYESHSLLWTLVLTFTGIFLIAKRKKNVSLEKIFIGWSLLMGFTVIAVRGHYAIDVLGAYFITVGIYIIGKKALSWLDRLCDRVEEEFRTIKNQKPSA